MLDRGKVGAGVLLYVSFVVAPTAGLLLAHYGWTSHALERVLVGVLGIIAGRLIWTGFRGGQAIPDPTKQRYWAFNPWLAAAGVFVIYLAWFTNLPIALAGNFEGSVFVVNEGHVVSLSALWPRIMTTLITAAGVFVLTRAVRSKRTPDERRVVREQRRIKKELRRQGKAEPTNE